MSRNNNEQPVRSGKVRKAGRNAPPPSLNTHVKRAPFLASPAIGCHVSRKIDFRKKPQYVPTPPRSHAYGPNSIYRDTLRRLGLSSRSFLSGLYSPPITAPPQCIAQETYYEGDHPKPEPRRSMWEIGPPPWARELELSARVRRYRDVGSSVDVAARRARELSARVNRYRPDQELTAA